MDIYVIISLLDYNIISATLNILQPEMLYLIQFLFASKPILN